MSNDAVSGKHFNLGVVLFIPRGSNETISKYLPSRSLASPEVGLIIVAKCSADDKAWKTPEPPGPPGYQSAVCSGITSGIFLPGFVRMIPPYLGSTTDTGAGSLTIAIVTRGVSAPVAFQSIGTSRRAH